MTARNGARIVRCPMRQDLNVYVQYLCFRVIPLRKQKKRESVGKYSTGITREVHLKNTVKWLMTELTW